MVSQKSSQVLFDPKKLFPQTKGDEHDPLGQLWQLRRRRPNGQMGGLCRTLAFETRGLLEKKPKVTAAFCDVLYFVNFFCFNIFGNRKSEKVPESPGVSSPLFGFRKNTIK